MRDVKTSLALVPGLPSMYLNSSWEDLIPYMSLGGRSQWLQERLNVVESANAEAGMSKGKTQQTLYPKTKVVQVSTR